MPPPARLAWHPSAEQTLTSLRAQRLRVPCPSRGTTVWPAASHPGPQGYNSPASPWHSCPWGAEAPSPRLARGTQPSLGEPEPKPSPARGRRTAAGGKGLTAVRAEPPRPPPALCFTGRRYCQEMFPSAPLIPLFTAL